MATTEQVLSNIKFGVTLLTIIVGFAMNWQSIQSRLISMEREIFGPPTLTSRVDKIEQSLQDIRTALFDIKDAVGSE